MNIHGGIPRLRGAQQKGNINGTRAGLKRTREIALDQVERIETSVAANMGSREYFDVRAVLKNGKVLTLADVVCNFLQICCEVCHGFDIVEGFGSGAPVEIGTSKHRSSHGTPTITGIDG